MERDMSKVPVSDEVVNIILLEHAKNWADEPETCAKIKALAGHGTVKGIVESFMESSWDLESFTRFVFDNVKDPTDAKNLLGEAVFRSDEWDT